MENSIPCETKVTQYARMGKVYMQKMLIPICKYFVVHGSLRARVENPAVSEDLLWEVVKYMDVEQCSWYDTLSRLRTKTVPSGYPIHPWINGTFIYTLCKSEYVHIHL